MKSCSILLLKLFPAREIQTLTTLQLDQNNIDVTGARHLANALRKNRVGENILFINFSNEIIWKRHSQLSIFKPIEWMINVFNI